MPPVQKEHVSVSYRACLLSKLSTPLYRMEHSFVSSETSHHHLRSCALHHADYASIIYGVVP